MIENWYKKSVYSQTQEELDLFTKDPWVSVDSSFIDAIAYHNLAGVLEIRLNNGKRYTFMDVPQEVYKAFLESPSKGNFFNTIVKQNYKKS